VVGKTEGKRPLGKTGCRRVDTVMMDVAEIRMGGVDWRVMSHDGYK
jgi:hypothetical protein